MPVCLRSVVLDDGGPPEANREAIGPVDGEGGGFTFARTIEVLDGHKFGGLVGVPIRKSATGAEAR
jgi:hypothetical protein